jgi:hypothetical protein
VRKADGPGRPGRQPVPACGARGQPRREKVTARAEPHRRAHRYPQRAADQRSGRVGSALVEVAPPPRRTLEAVYTASAEAINRHIRPRSARSPSEPRSAVFPCLVHRAGEADRAADS